MAELMTKEKFFKLMGFNILEYTILDATEIKKYVGLENFQNKCFKIFHHRGVAAFGKGSYTVNIEWMKANAGNIVEVVEPKVIPMTPVEEIVEQSGIPKDNVIIAKMPPIDPEGVKVEAIGEVLNELEAQVFEEKGEEVVDPKVKLLQERLNILLAMDPANEVIKDGRMIKLTNTDTGVTNLSTTLLKNYSEEAFLNVVKRHTVETISHENRDERIKRFLEIADKNYVVEGDNFRSGGIQLPIKPILEMTEAKFEHWLLEYAEGEKALKNEPSTKFIDRTVEIVKPLAGKPEVLEPADIVVEADEPTKTKKKKAKAEVKVKPEVKSEPIRVVSATGATLEAYNYFNRSMDMIKVGKDALYKITQIEELLASREADTDSGLSDGELLDKVYEILN